MMNIYMDYNASTPIAPEVAESMMPFLAGHYGNPSSNHWAGQPAKEAVEHARSQSADFLGCLREEIVFTSGGTESNNHAVKGIFYSSRNKGNHIITTSVEHPAIIQPCRFLEKLGAAVTYLPVDGSGMVNPDDVRKAITDKTVLVTVMHANNEVGTIQPIKDIAEITRDCGIVFHTDAAQSAGKISTHVRELEVDLLSLAGHKMYAPKGVGVLYIRQGLYLEPFVHGAGHESGRRAGTENVLLDVGIGKACELAKSWIDMEQVKLLRDSFWEKLRGEFGKSIVLNGHPQQRLPNTLNVSFVGRVGADILAGLEGVAASTGSACHEGSVELSPVLSAMGISKEVGMGAIRFSLGRATTEEEIDHVMGLLQNLGGRDRLD